MYIKSLEIYNYGPFRGTHKIDFNDKSEVIFVTGTHEDNPKSSNWAGKSSFIEAIGYLLFGDTRDGLKEVDLIHTGQDEMYVSGVVVVEGKDINIKRGRTKENKPILEIEGLKGSKSVREKEFQELIGIDSVDFFNTYFFKQNKIHDFMESSPTERKRLLQKWLKLDRWKTYEDKAKEKLFEQKTDVHDYERTLESLQSRLASLESQITDDASLTIEISSRMKSLQDSNERLVNFKTELAKFGNLKDLEESIAKLKSDIPLFTDKIKQLKNRYYELSLEREEALGAKGDLAKILEIQHDSSTELQHKIDNIKTSLQNLSNQMSKYKAEIEKDKKEHQCLSQFTGVCPIDHKPCDKGTRIPDEANKLWNVIFNATSELEILSGKYESELGNVKFLEKEKIESLNRENKIKELESKSDVDKYDKLSQSVQENIEVYANKLNETNINIENLLKNTEILNTSKKVELEKNINDEVTLQSMLQNRLKELNTELGRQKQLKESKLEIENSVIETKKLLVGARQGYYRWSYISWMLGKDGIPSILIENSLTSIEDWANIILMNIGSKMKVQFITQKEVSSKETHCSICGNPFVTDKCSNCNYGYRKNKIKDEIDLRISNGYGDFNFSQNSGGGKVIISLAVRLALAKVLSDKSKRCETLVLDEVFGSLDSVNRDSVSRMVFNTLSNVLGFRKVFVITHCELNDYNYKNIKILRKNGFSQIIA